MQLRDPGVLARRIEEIDRIRKFRRIYVMGCGRSGTWLLTSLLATFVDVEIVPSEVPVEDFGLLATDRSVLILKRHHGAYERIETIPDAIEIAMIVRHPFAVLTSHNPTTSLEYHISPHRWLGEMLALQYLLDARRPRTTILRYEDLATSPDIVQARLADETELAVAHAARDAHKVFTGSPEAVAAMHGLRPIDTNSLDTYRQSPEKMNYLRSIRPRLGRLLDWVAAEYGYDITL